MIGYSLSVHQKELAADPDPYRVESVDRAMRLLGVLLDDRDAISVSGAAALLRVAPSTAHRLLTTMARRGFVHQRADRRYGLGRRLYGVSPQTRHIAPLRQLLRPYLHTLFEAVGETSHLMALVATDMQFVDGIESSQNLRVGLRIGARIPAYCTSGGKATLAELGDEIVAGLYRDGLQSWPGATVATLDELRAELSHVRSQRFGLNREENEAGVVAIGATLGAVHGYPPAAFAVAIPSIRVTPEHEQRTAEALRLVCAGARRLLARAGAA